MKIYLISTIYLLIFSMSSIISAQSLNFKTIPSDKAQFDARFEKPFFSSLTSLSTLSGVYQFSLNIPISSKLNLISDIPYMYSNYKIVNSYRNTELTQNGFGNIFIGVQTNQPTINGRKSTVSFGVFLPTAEKKLGFNGLFTNYYDFQKYTLNSWGFIFNYAYYKFSNNGLYYGLEVGPNISIQTIAKRTLTDIFMHYGINVGYKIDKLLLNVEFLGIAIITEDTNNFGDRFVNLLDFGAQWKGTSLTPKLFYKIYLKNDMRDIVDGILGVGISVSIN